MSTAAPMQIWNQRDLTMIFTILVGPERFAGAHMGDEFSGLCYGIPTGGNRTSLLPQR